MKFNRNTLVALVLFAGLMSSCRLLDPSVMLKTKRDYPFGVASDTLPTDYIMQAGDVVMFRLFSNQGFKIIDLTSLDEGSRVNAGLNNQNTFTYLIEPDSSINLPIIGRAKIAGLNLKEAEAFLEDKFSNYYNDPFVMLQVNNRRVVVYPGAGGAAKVIQIDNQYTTVIEALALAGGISTGGKAHKIKVLRGNLDHPEVFKLDLSTVEGMKEANLVYVRANDIIYVEPSYFVGKQILQTTSSLLGLVSSLIVTYFLVVQFTAR
ncbi:MAG: polysaccharide biosynthesis/export family protein [Cryomorphaceae bacterium]